MAPENFDLLLAAAAVGIAGWSHVIDSPQEQIDYFENRLARFFTAVFLLFSQFIIIWVLVALMLGFGTYSGQLGGAGTAVYMVLVAIGLASIPSAAKVSQAISRETDGFDAIQYVIGIVLFLIFCGGLFVVIQFGN